MTYKPTQAPAPYKKIDIGDILGGLGPRLFALAVPEAVQGGVAAYQSEQLFF